MTSYYTHAMGERLQAEVERQLLEDLAHYGTRQPDLKIEWADACGEGHCIHAFGGELQEVSSLLIVDAQGSSVAEGWMDFVHGGDNNSLYVFWLFLYVFENGNSKQVKSQPTIPDHIWNRLSAETRLLCAKEGSYDARWSQDPLVRAWKQHGDDKRAKFKQALAKVSDAPPEPHDAL